MTDMASNMELNCEGLRCPLPILKTKKAIDALNSGDILKMTLTDPGSANDMASWTKRTGHEILSHSEAAGVHTFFIRKE